MADALIKYETIDDAPDPAKSWTASRPRRLKAGTAASGPTRRASGGAGTRSHAPAFGSGRPAIR